MTRMGAVWIPVVMLGVSVVAAQQSRPAFEVASVRAQTTPMPFPPPSGARPQVLPGGRFAGTHATVASLIMSAYDLKDLHQVSGGPQWVRQGYFDVNGIANPEASVGDIRLMVRALLEERFSIVAHSEQRETDHLTLTLARRDGQPGPYFVPVEGECSREKTAEARKRFPSVTVASTGGMMSGCSTPQEIASLLSQFLQTLVIDETGLNGKFVYEARLGAIGLQPSNQPSDPALPPLPVALEEQLGLKLQSRRGPIEVLVIDSIQPPTGN